MRHRHWQVHIHLVDNADVELKDLRYILRTAFSIDGEPQEVQTLNFTGTERDLQRLFDYVEKYLKQNVT